MMMTKSSSMIRIPLFFYATVGSSALLLLLCLLSADPVSSFIGSSPSSQVRLLLHHHSRPSLLLTGVKPQQHQHIMLQPLSLRTLYDSSLSSSLSSSSIDDNSNDSDDIIATSTSSSLSGGSLLLPFIDNYIVRKIIKISNHIPALASIGYFGLISGASMMNKNGNNMPATLVSVLTKSIGTTSNKEFSNYFSTLITPPSWVFLIWPFISVVQLLTVMYSAIRCSAVDDGSDAVAVLKQDDLTALSLSNLMASFWLYFSSKATKDYLPLGSFLVLPLVPLLSGYPLRIRRKLLQQQNKMEKQTKIATTTTTKARPLFVYQVYSSFTTIAALLALTQEIQYGGRILPFIFMNRPELCAMVFLSLIGYIVSRPTSNNSSSNNNIVSKIITTSVLWGIVSKRNIDTFTLLSTAATTTTSAATATATATNLIPLLGLFGSISYFTTTILAIISTIKLFNFFSNSV